MFGFGLISLLVVVFLQKQGAKKSFPSVSPTPSEQRSYLPPTLSAPQSPPEIFFETYENKASIPYVPETVKTYTFKTNFLLSEILNLGTQLGLSQQKISDDYVIVYNTTDEKNRGILTFNRKTGVFFFQSFGEHKAKTSQQLPVPTLAQNFLRDIGLIDETVLCEITYQQKDIPDVTFVECHRNWGLVGLPILNFLGVLNIPETRTLASLKLGEVDETTPTDPNIINVSMGGDGKRRPIDFNSVTVGIANDGRIISIDSNLRQITAANAVSKGDLLTPEEALSQFMNYQSQFSLTIPAGAGTFAQERVYPENKARAERAIITDYLLVFLENPPQVNQTDLVPMYVIRGTAELSSGYRVRFTETVPALKNGYSPFLRGSLVGSVAGVVVQADERSIKLGIFTPVPTSTQTQTQTQTPPSPIPSSPSLPFPSAPCVPDEAHLSPIYDLAGLGRVGRFPTNLEWYFIPFKDQPLPDLEQVIAEFEKKLRLSYESLRHIKELQREWSDSHCPIRLTAGSPTLFVYAPEGTLLTIKPSVNITYSDPPLIKAIKTPRGWQAGMPVEVMTPPRWRDQDAWQITVDKNNQLNINGLLRPFIYYEYEPIVFEKPKEGWIIKKSKIQNFARETISSSLKLTSQEEDRLVFELTHASFDLNADYLFICLIDQKEVEEKLSLEITPQPKVILRYHFYLKSSSGKESTTPPRLLPISRSNFMILELGAVKAD